MYRSQTWLALACVGSLSLVPACSSDDPTGPARERVTAVRGTIRDAAGAPIPGVSVSAGSASALSRADGKYDLRAPAGSQVVRFEKDGFVAVVVPIDVVAMSPTQRDVAMLAQAAAMPLDATAGGSVTGMRGAGLMAPAGAFVTSTGTPVTGMVDVRLTPVDPSNTAELRAASGNFTANSGGMRVMLESLGMMDVTVRQGTETLEVAAGSELEIRIPAAAGATTPDPMIQLWSIDDATGLWVDEGMAMYDAPTRTYVARTRHMSMWNVDKIALATCVCGRVNERGAGPLPGARVQADGVSYFGSSEATTDDMGRFCIAVRKDSDVAIAAYHASGGGESRRVRSGTADTMVPPMMGDARCVDVGEWTVERDVFRSDTGGTLRCEDVTNPFTTGCAGELWSLLDCYQPTGMCTIRTDGLTSTVTYANGSRSTTTFSGMVSETMMFSPTGTLCATSTMDVSGGTATDLRMVYTIAATGQMYTMIIPSSDTGDMIIECPGGGRVVMTPEQRQASEACFGGDSGTTMCTREGGGMIGAPCTTDPECASVGAVCCTIPMAGSSFCLTAADCTAAGGT